MTFISGLVSMNNMELTLTSAEWQAIAIQAMQKNRILQAELDAHIERRAITNGVETQLGMISLMLPLNK